MGYDCTLHLVDERAIQRQLLPRLLGKSRKALGFEARKGGAALLAEARRATLEGDPEMSARALTELAIQFSSALLPHVAARGVALSLWRYAPRKVRQASPLALGGSPEPLFAPLVRRRPALAGCFPTCFVENEMTGVFIPAARIAAARTWMAHQLAALSPGDRLQLEPIERVLAAAARHRLAYWEATDLGVAQAHEELLAPAMPEATQVRGRWKLPRPARGVIGRVGERVFVRLDDDSLGQIDIAALPPRITRLAIDYATFLATAAGRAWLTVERRQDVRPFRFRLFTRARGLTGPAVEAAPAWPGRALEGVVRLGDRIFARDADARPPRLLHWVGKSFVPAELPAAKGHKGAFVFGQARTGDGAEVLVWDGNGYELVRGKLVKTFPLAATTRYGGWSSAPTPGGEFHYTLDGQIFLAQRGQRPRGVATKLRNVQRLAPGPGDTTLLRLGDNRQAWAVARLAGSHVVGLTQRELTHPDDDVHAIEWSAPAGALFVFTDQAVIALPATVFEGHPRASARSKANRKSVTRSRT